MTPVFLLSLPRSGSTFVQRVLATDPAVATASEPWIMLPLVYGRRGFGIYAEYGQEWATVAFEDFEARLPAGAAEVDEAIRRYALYLYERGGGGASRYFVDKTPRYALIVDDLLRIFPDAKFVVLWRNPLAVVASILETWGNGGFNLHDYYIDLYGGLARLIQAAEDEPARLCPVRYEDLIETPEAAWPRVFAHLGLAYERDALDRFGTIDLDARVGDQTGRRRYDRPSAEPLTKWRAALHNPLRRRWCERYLRWIGSERLLVMGYRLDDLLRDLHHVPASWSGLGRDLISATRGAAFGALELRMMKDKFADARSVSAFVPHH